MERLTKANIRDNGRLDGKSFTETIEYIKKIIDKLEQLEDIEDELGIDLITLFRAIYNGVYYIKNNQIAYEKTIGLCNENINIADRPKFTRLYVNHIYVLFSDYGKTWALTREELEETK